MTMALLLPWAQAALRALVAALAVWAGVRLLRVTNVVIEKIVWALVLAGALALPLLPAGFSFSSSYGDHLASSMYARMQQEMETRTSRPARALANPASAPLQAQSSRLEMASSVHVGTSVPATPISVASPAQESPSAPTQQAAVPHSARTRGWLPRGVFVAAGSLYLVVALAFFLRLTVGLFVAFRLLRASQPVQCAQAGGASVRMSHKLHSPVTVGSTVLLPAGFVLWSEEKLAMVLAHESSHIRQGDFYLQVVAGLYAALVWPSPLGWWLKRRLSELSEAIGDRAALDVASSPAAYARLLLEFAALPRPTELGVAMARTSRLSLRIERLLNESSFSRAFARSRGAIAALLVVPAALALSTTLVRVYAATPAQAPQPTAQAAPAADLPPAPPAEPGMTPPPPPEFAGQPPMPPQGGRLGNMPPPPPGAPFGPQGEFGPEGQMGAGGPGQPGEPGPQGGAPFGLGGPQGEPYALVGGEKDVRRGPRLPPEELEKARKLAHGDFLWFRREGKSYIVDDPAVVAQAKAASAESDVFGKKLRVFDEQQREAIRKMADQARQLHQAEVKLPDLTREMGELNKALATLKSKQGASISPQDLGQIERQLGDLQRRLGEAQMRGMGPLPQVPPFSPEMKKKLEEMRKLGDQFGQSFHESDEKIRSAIDESLKNGKAKLLN